MDIFSDDDDGDDVVPELLEAMGLSFDGDDGDGTVAGDSDH